MRYFKISFYFFNENTEQTFVDKKGDKFLAVDEEKVTVMAPKEIAKIVAIEKMDGTNYEDYSVKECSQKEYRASRRNQKTKYQ